MSKSGCVICGREQDKRRAPFCSARCADVDLNRWLTGFYVAPLGEEDEEGDEPPLRRADGVGEESR